MVAHAEGANTRASGKYSHSEGQDTKAKGHTSHAEGAGTETGENTVAAHVQGYRTKATANFQDVSGKYNKIDDNKAVIVGNGNSNTERSNAYELDWEGNAWFAGNIKIGGEGQDDLNAESVATQEYVQLNKVGQKTETEGEVFNDYKNNKASSMSHAEGSNTKAEGIYFRFLQ